MSKEKDDIQKDIGHRIQECRKKANLTQEELGEITGISPKHISRLERGLHRPHVDMLIKIANALDVPLDAFVQDLSSDNLNIFLQSIKTELDGMSMSQLSLVRDVINAIKKYKF
jgi:putative regulatory protein